MSTSEWHRPKPNRRTRTDGWTAARQLHFLKMLEQTRSVSRAARSAGISRESAYRLRERRDGALFALLWDQMLAFQTEVHTPPLTDGRLMRLLGNHFRRERRDFAAFGRKRP
jgi:hypothetical protein